jgi:hypothetical protein
LTIPIPKVCAVDSIPNIVTIKKQIKQIFIKLRYKLEYKSSTRALLK